MAVLSIQVLNCVTACQLAQVPQQQSGPIAGAHTPAVKGAQIRPRVNVGGPRYGRMAVRNRQLEVRSCHCSGSFFFCRHTTQCKAAATAQQCTQLFVSFGPQQLKVDSTRRCTSHNHAARVIILVGSRSWILEHLQVYAHALLPPCHPVCPSTPDPVQMAC
jgi:hypothetical protein